MIAVDHPFQMLSGDSLRMLTEIPDASIDSHRVRCLEYAIDNGEAHGVWGGKSVSERRDGVKGAA